LRIENGGLWPGWKDYSYLAFMNHFKRTSLLSILIFLPLAFLVGCEVETEARGRVTNSETGLPIAGVHVMGEVEVLMERE
jgi:hypothetical protein